VADYLLIQPLCDRHLKARSYPLQFFSVLIYAKQKFQSIGVTIVTRCLGPPNRNASFETKIGFLRSGPGLSLC